MALNWSAYLADDALDQSNEQWPEVSTPRTARPPTTSIAAAAAAAPTNTTNDQSTVRLTPESDSVSPFDSQNTADPLFTEDYFQSGDYFLSDLEILQPFGDSLADTSTSDSSPEPLSAADLFDRKIFPSVQNQTGAEAASPSQSRPGRQSSLLSRTDDLSNILSQHQQAYSNLQDEPMFSAKAGFIEDITFPNGPSGAPKTTTTTLNRDSDSIVVSREPETTVKRVKQGKADTLSACWTSPLCPNHTENGPPPDPTTCGGACAPFLFAQPDGDNPATIMDQSMLAREISIEDEPSTARPEDTFDNVRRLKRSESESSNVPSGRVFAKNTSKPTVAPNRAKRESIPHPEDDSTSPDGLADLAEDHPTAKPRRRLPHNQVERKYRESLNTQLESLRRVVPSLKPQQLSGSQSGIDIEDLPAPSKPSKAVVLASATAYIKQMEKDKKTLADENQMLKTRIKALQALVKCEDCSLMQYVMNLKIQGAA